MRQHFVYRVYDRAGRLLYVGCTKRPRARWAEHRSNSDWARRAVRCRLVGPLPYDVARELERQALATEQPLYGWTPARRSAHSRQSARTRSAA